MLGGKEDHRSGECERFAPLVPITALHLTPNQDEHESILDTCGDALLRVADLPKQKIVKLVIKAGTCFSPRTTLARNRLTFVAQMTQDLSAFAWPAWVVVYPWKPFV
jgi:hypothetical protein